MSAELTGARCRPGGKCCQWQHAPAGYARETVQEADMNRKKMLFIYNPRAGKAQIRSNLLDMIDVFTKAGYEVTAYPTQAKGDGDGPGCGFL